jgi:hypothetical protein
MRKMFAFFTAAIIFCLLMLAFSLPATRTAEAARPDQTCEHCQRKVGEKYEKCIAKNPSDPTCGDEFNLGIVHCYATVCEG